MLSDIKEKIKMLHEQIVTAVFYFPTTEKLYTKNVELLAPVCYNLWGLSLNIL